MRRPRRFPHRAFYRLLREFCKQDEAKYVLQRFLHDIKKNEKINKSPPR